MQMYYPALMMITCQACLCESEHRSCSQVNVLCGLFFLLCTFTKCVCVCVCVSCLSWTEVKQLQRTQRSHSPPLPPIGRKAEDQRCCAISPHTGIIRRRIWFISLWKEGYLPPCAEGPSTSNRAQVLWSPTRSRRWVERRRAPLWLPCASWLCLRLWTPAPGRWMAIFSHVRDLMWSDSWEDFGP